MKLIFPILLTSALFIHNTCFSSEKPVSPILLLVTQADFGTYTAEILKAEGFNEYEEDSLGDTKVTLSYLKQFDLLILGETSITPGQKTLLTAYVEAGGNIIAFRPHKMISELFGISESKGTLSEGYIKINTSHETGRGLVPVTIQFHGKSDLCELYGAQEVAGLYSDALHSTEFPAVVINQYGKGHTAAFTYNLPGSIVYTRQGNPDWAGEERDKVDGPTATDLFYPLAGEIQWNNPDKITIPQADEQMRLLSHIIENFSSYKKPLPRFWYFPEQYRCIFIFTIDGENTPEKDIGQEIAEVNDKGAKATLYEIGTYISTKTVAAWRSNGNEVAIHYNDVPNYAHPTYLNMNAVLDTMTDNFRKVYGFSPITARNHWVVWCSRDQAEKKQFAEQALMEEKHGLGLDCNYYQFGGNKVYPNWLGDAGNFTGSGIPMKFAENTGKILNIYQSNTQLPDETWLKENIESKCKTLIDRSMDEENFAWLNANFHTWYWGECRTAGLRVLDYCHSRDVPVWTAAKAYEFLKMKDEATFSGFTWSGNQLGFRLSSSLKHTGGLTFLLPANHGDTKVTRITVNGKALHFQQRMIKGHEYALLTVMGGNTYEISVNYQ